MAPLKELEVAPGLLLSMPQLADPNFERSVILMLEHDDEGSFGLVLNQPSDTPMNELLALLELDWQGDREAVVWNGGPVMPTSGWVLHGPSAVAAEIAPTLQQALEKGGSFALGSELFLSSSPEILGRLAENPPDDLRFFLGYSGWGPGQLAEEMMRGSWLHASTDPELIFRCPAEDMWLRALRSLGIEPEIIVESRGIH